MTTQNRITEIYSSNMTETEEEARVYVDNEDAFLAALGITFEDAEAETLEWLAEQAEAYESDCDVEALSIAYNQYCRQRGGAGYVV